MAVLLCYCVIVPLCYCNGCVIVLLCYCDGCVIVLLCFCDGCVIVLLCFCDGCVIVLLCYCVIVMAVLSCYCAIVSLCQLHVRLVLLFLFAGGGRHQVVDRQRCRRRENGDCIRQVRLGLARTINKFTVYMCHQVVDRQRCRRRENGECVRQVRLGLARTINKSTVYICHQGVDRQRSKRRENGDCVRQVLLGLARTINKFTVYICMYTILCRDMIIYIQSYGRMCTILANPTGVSVCPIKCRCRHEYKQAIMEPFSAPCHRIVTHN